MKRAALLAITIVMALRAQYPPDIHWQKIVTPHFEIVFPGEIAADAQRAANTLEALYAPLTTTLGANFKRTTVLLPNANVTRYVGGYVALFPRMAVFNSMPAQGFWGTNDWLNTLAAEEGRHLAQIAKMNHSFGKLASTLFGESGLAAVLGWTLPDWWVEGDSRVAETTMLRGGVGQFASSEEATRTLLLSGQHFSYMKAIHGSFTDAVPNQAELGAFLVSHVERTSGPDAWDKIMARAAKWSWNPFAMGIALKKETGRNAAETYYETTSQLSELYKSKADQVAFVRPQIVNTAPKKVFTGYFQPVFEADGSVLAQKSGMDIYPIEMVRIHPDGREEKLFRIAPAVNGSNRTSVVNGKMVIDEYVPDLRWRRGYSEILIRDMTTGHTRRLTHRTRFMNPAVSPDAARVAVVEYLPDRKCSLVLLDANTGNEVRRLPSPDNDMIYSPTWSADGRRVAMVTQSRQGRAIQVADVESGTFREVIPHSDDDLANPVFSGDYVLYKSSRDGVNNIYAVAIVTGRRFRITASQFGADCPAISPDGKKLLFNDYTFRGNNLAELPLDPASWVPIDAVTNSGLNYHRPYHDYTADAANTQYPVTTYKPSMNLFDFHSWGLTSPPPDLGFGLISNDKMGLMDFNASLIYNTNERTTGFETGFSYNRFFPVLDFSAADQNRSITLVTGNEHWNERTVSTGFHIPLNLARGYYNTGLSFGASVESLSRQGGGLVPLTYGLSFSRTRQSSPRDLAPVWGQQIQFTYRQTPWANNYTANYLFADGRFAFPGLVKHHSIVLEAGYERQNGNYFFSSEMIFPRGYAAIVAPNLTKLSSNYELPLLYPDWSLSQFALVKRISSNVFYDYGKAADRLYRSTGLELIFDLGVLHFPFDLRFGMRYAYLLDYHGSRVQPFLAYRW